MQNVAKRCKPPLQRFATFCNVLQRFCNVLQRFATFCNVLQRFCNVLQRFATFLQRFCNVSATFLQRFCNENATFRQFFGRFCTFRRQFYYHTKWDDRFERSLCITHCGNLRHEPQHTLESDESCHAVIVSVATSRRLMGDDLINLDVK
jgi:hypothetical protein